MIKIVFYSSTYPFLYLSVCQSIYHFIQYIIYDISYYIILFLWETLDMVFPYTTQYMEEAELNDCLATMTVSTTTLYMYVLTI